MRPPFRTTESAWASVMIPADTSAEVLTGMPQLRTVTSRLSPSPATTSTIPPMRTLTTANPSSAAVATIDRNVITGPDQGTRSTRTVRTTPPTSASHSGGTHSHRFDSRPPQYSPRPTPIPMARRVGTMATAGN